MQHHSACECHKISDRLVPDIKYNRIESGMLRSHDQQSTSHAQIHDTLLRGQCITMATYLLLHACYVRIFLAAHFCNWASSCLEGKASLTRQNAFAIPVIATYITSRSFTREMWWRKMESTSRNLGCLQSVPMQLVKQHADLNRLSVSS